MADIFRPMTIKAHSSGALQTLGVDSNWYPELQNTTTGNLFNDLTNSRKYVDADGLGVKRALGNLSWTDDKIYFPNDKEIMFRCTRDLYWFIVGFDDSTGHDLLLGVGTGQNNIVSKMKNNNGSANIITIRHANYFNRMSQPMIMCPNIRNNYLRTRHTDTGVYVDMSKDKITWETVASVPKNLVGYVGNKFGLWFDIAGLEGTEQTMLRDFSIYNPRSTGDVPVHDDKYVIVAVAGQSNAVGYDESTLKPQYKVDWNPRLIQLTWGNAPAYLTNTAEDVQDVKSLRLTGMHMPLANEILKYIPEDYKVLIIPVDYGGTGFNNGSDGSYDNTNKRANREALRWGINSAYYKMLKDRVSLCLNQNIKNRFAGVVWVQGEADVSNPANHKAKFEEMTNDFVKYMNTNYADRCKEGKFTRKLWFNVESTKYWKAMQGYQTILQNYRNWSPESYVEIPTDTDTNEINGTGRSSSVRPSHYGNGAYYKVIAPRVVKKMLENNAL